MKLIYEKTASVRGHTRDQSYLTSDPKHTMSA